MGTPYLRKHTRTMRFQPVSVPPYESYAEWEAFWAQEAVETRRRNALHRELRRAAEYRLGGFHDRFGSMTEWRRAMWWRNLFERVAGWVRKVVGLFSKR